MSVNTYKHHMKSQKHKKNRDRILSHSKMSKSSSESDFSVIGLEKPEKCFFCHQWNVSDHLKTKHNFPPFAEECINVEGLKKHVENKIKKGYCCYCHLHFLSEESAKQHMIDLGHNMLNIQNFNEYEKFYLWKIAEVSSEEEQLEVIPENMSNISSGVEILTEEHMKEESDESFEDLKRPTL